MKQRVLRSLYERWCYLNSEPNKDREEHHLECMRALRDMERKFAARPDLPAVTEALLETVVRLHPRRAATICLLDETTSRLEAVAWRNLAEPEWKPTAAIGDLATVVAAESRPSMITAVGARSNKDALRLLREHDFAAYLGIPLPAMNETIGVLSLYDKRSRAFSEHEIELLTTLAGQAAIALENARLYRRTLAQSAALDQANQALARSNRTRSDLLSIMSHEFRTPLNLIVGYAGMLKEGSLGKITAEQQKASERILTSSDDLLALVMTLLEAAAIEANDVRLKCEAVGLSRLLAQLKADLRVPRDKELEIVWDYPADLPVVMTDGGKLKQVLHNLIDNAVKFTDRGRIQVSSRPLPQGKQVQFEIFDTGVGIPSEALPIIFEKFQQLDSSVTRPYAGLGLGLYIAKKFTELLGGELSVSTELGKGSKFTVALPVGA
jgi:signal transduction histidine kinase